MAAYSVQSGESGRTATSSPSSFLTEIYGGAVTIDIKFIRVKVTSIMAERSQLPAPMPTAMFPTPPTGAKCSFCRRVYALTPQPLNTRKSPFLEVCRKGATECIVCRNTMAWTYKG